MSNLKAPDVWTNRGKVTVWVVGAGGNGGEAIDALAQFSLALKALGGPNLEVTIIDDAKVREVNLVRQRFWAGDVGAFKSITLANRYNLLLGMRWQGVPGRLEDVAEKLSSAPDILITAVDLASTRRWVGSHRWGATARSPMIWLDLGNNARNGQAILGSIGGEGHPTVLDHYPEIEGMARRHHQELLDCRGHRRPRLPGQSRRGHSGHVADLGAVASWQHPQERNRD